MKKKIGDLTIKEARAICDSRTKKGFPHCVNGCPLYFVCGCFDEFNENRLDQEIEVDSND